MPAVWSEQRLLMVETRLGEEHLSVATSLEELAELYYYHPHSAP